MKVLLTTLIVLLGMAVPASAQTILIDKHSSRSTKIVYKKSDPQLELMKSLVPNYKFFIAIGRCEQPGDGKWGIAWRQVRNYSYPGGLGVWAPLWEEEGIKGTDLASSADRATPIEQMIHAQRIIDKYGKWAWGCTGEALAQAPFYEEAKAPSRKKIMKMRQNWKF